ncbi:MAG: MoaD/ThiS family protein [Aureliella sp.]
MTKHSIRVVVPYHLQTLAKIGSEVSLEIHSPATHDSVIDALERAYPTLRGTIRDHVTKERRPLLRYFVCSKDVSHEPADTLLPNAVLTGDEPFIIWGAVAGG